MEYLVRKRDGKIVPFDRERITNAIFKAAKAVGGSDRVKAEDLANQVSLILYERFFRKGSIPHVEEIQDLVEKVLIENGHAQVAKAYILYREQRRVARDLKKALVDGMELVDHYLGKEDWRVRENSNMNYSLQGLNFHIASSVVARYWLNRLYPQEVREAHEEGDFHIHDLGILAAYCVGWDLEDLLRRGFGGVPGKVEARPARHLRTALGQVVNFFYTLQGEAAGAQAFSNFDTLLAPFVRYDNLDYRGVKQCLQEFLFNLNVPTRVGFQTPFTNITMDLVPPYTFRDRKVVWGGEEQEATYGEFQKEMDMINRAFAELMLEGDAKGRIFTFPIPTYNISKDFSWEKEELKPLWEMTGKYGIPYFANFVNADMKPEDARSMCCRLRLDNRELQRRGGGLFGASPLTGSIGVVTLNLPRMAYLSRNESEFFERLGRYMELAKVSLEIKRKVIEDYTDKGLYPYSRVYLSEVKRCQGQYWYNHFSTIGLIGMNEACLNFLGLPIYEPEAREWAIKVLNFMREKLSEFQEETGNLYNLEATPAEGASYRLAKRDAEKFPGIITRGREHPYYTNSVHLPVDYTGDLWEILEHQDALQVLFTGGTVVHLFLGESIRDYRAVRELVRSIVTNYHLPYFSITPTFSVCPVHGYIPGEHTICPYPHTLDELEVYGEELELDEESLKGVAPGAYLKMD
ncbi:MAG: ribonucleoside triphosphate reductase [Aquificota bacterium]|nr:MAG: ribonucleoside triphosphate reductase [Aquificota bacterium]